MPKDIAKKIRKSGHKIGQKIKKPTLVGFDEFAKLTKKSWQKLKEITRTKK